MLHELRTAGFLKFLASLLWLALPTFLLFFRFAGDVVAVGFSLALLWRSVSTGDWAWLRRPWVGALVLLSVFAALVVSPWSAEPLSAFGHSVAYLRWPMFAAALGYWLLPQDHHRRWFEYGLVLVVTFIIGDTTLQYFRGIDLLGHVVPADATRLTGPFTKLVPGTLALRFFFVALACVYLRFGALLGERFRVPMLVVLMATGSAFEFLTGERMAFLCMLLGSAIVLLMLPRRAGQSWAPIAVTAVVAAMVLAVFAVSQPKMVERTLGSTVDTIAGWGESPYGHTMRRAVVIWLDQSPWLGVGPKVYKGLCLSDRFAEVAARFPTAACQHPHNPYLEWFVSAGPVGGILFIFAIGLLLRDIWFGQGAGGHSALRPFAVATLVVSFWPVMSAMSIFNGWIMGIVWSAIAWAVAVTAGSSTTVSDRGP